MTRGLGWVGLFWCLQMEYSFFIFTVLLKLKFCRLGSSDTPHDTDFLFAPRSRSWQRREEKARPRGWRWWRWWWRRRLRANWKREPTELPFLPHKPERPPSYDSLCNPRLLPPPPQLWALFMGQDCTGWVGQVELPSLFFSPPTPWNWEPPNTLHLTYPTAPRFSGSPALSIPQFHCRSLFMYSRVRTLGLVSSFGSVLLIFCWKNYFLLLGLLFLIFCLLFLFLFLIFPNKIIAIAAVQPASHDF